MVQNDPKCWKGWKNENIGQGKRFRNVPKSVQKWPKVSLKQDESPKSSNKNLKESKLSKNFTRMPLHLNSNQLGLILIQNNSFTLATKPGFGKWSTFSHCVCSSVANATRVLSVKWSIFICLRRIKTATGLISYERRGKFISWRNFLSKFKNQVTLQRNWIPLSS